MSIRFDHILGKLLTRYVKTSGDTMTGTLAISAGNTVDALSVTSKLAGYFEQTVAGGYALYIYRGVANTSTEYALATYYIDNVNDTRPVLELHTEGSGPHITADQTLIIAPITDSTTAVQVRKADVSTVVLNVDTTNGRVGINVVPTKELDVGGTLVVRGSGTSSSLELGHTSLAITDVYVTAISSGLNSTFNFKSKGTGGVNYNYSGGGAGATGAFNWYGGKATPTFSVSSEGVTFIDGTSDAIQLRVQAHSTQTANILEIQSSASAVLASIDGTGVLTTAGYKSSDGSAGITSTVTFYASATSGGTVTVLNTVTVKNGIITGWTQV